MQLPNQIDIISIARAANAAHYEYLATVRPSRRMFSVAADLKSDAKYYKDLQSVIQ